MNIDALTYKDEEGPVPDVLDEDNGMIVEPPNVVLSPRVQAAIVQIDALSNDNNYAIDLYNMVIS